MRERQYRVTAIVLKRSDVGEADRLLTLLTLQRGKLRAVAKGARKPSARKTGHVELFNCVELQIAVAREIDIVTQAQTLEPFLRLRDDLDRLSYGYYFVELVDRFVEEEIEHREVYELMLDALQWLVATRHLSRTARFFEMQLLDVLGYRPQLNVCVQSKAELLPEENLFSPSAGGVLKPQYRDMYRDAISVSVNALKVMRYLQTRNFVQVEELNLSQQIEAEVEAILHYYVTHLLERNLKSVDFLNTLKHTDARIKESVRV
ncbi:MAG: DNA repair protein RecO [Anaerolineae bacterium]|nr:DNA repair protein RecO [Anaerolineae bacterium]